MDALFELAALLFVWRIVASVAAGCFLAVSAVRWIPWFGGLQGLALVFLSFVGGYVWQELAMGTSLYGPDGPRPTHAFVLHLSLLLAGAGWGFLSSTSFGSAALGAAIAVVAVAFLSVSRRSRSVCAWGRQVALRSVSLFAGYASALLFVDRGAVA